MSEDVDRADGHDQIPASVEEIDAEQGHWNHLLPQEDWERVVAEADRIYAERAAAETEKGGAEYLPLGLTPRVVRFPDTHGKNSGKIVRQQLWVLHSAECPLRAGFAESLTKWANGGYNPRASWQRFIDPATRVDWIPNNRAAFLHGPANSLGMGWEQAGYARFNRFEWLTPDGLRQMDLLAQDIVACGITKDALRWLTDAQVKAIVDRKDTTTRGLCTHGQISPSTRTDPGKGYPKDVLLTWVKSYHPDGGNTRPGTPGTLRLGDRGPDVEALQKQLNARGYTLDEDGVFGPKTDAAVRSFQRQHALDVDGIVGPQTMAALNKPVAPAKPKPTPPKEIEDMNADELRDLIREVVQEVVWSEQTARTVATTHAVVLDPRDPFGDRVTLSNLIEHAAGILHDDNGKPIPDGEGGHVKPLGYVSGV